MKKFSKLLEDVQNEKFFKIEAHIQLIVSAENEGEAGYLSDSILASVESMSNYQLMNIEETNERLVENSDVFGMYPGKSGPEPDDYTIDELIEKSWEAQFGDKTPTTAEKMEWYHEMRKAGFDGIKIFNVLKNRF